MAASRRRCRRKAGGFGGGARELAPTPGGGSRTLPAATPTVARRTRRQGRGLHFPTEDMQKYAPKTADARRHWEKGEAAATGLEEPEARPPTRRGPFPAAAGPGQQAPLGAAALGLSGGHR